MRDDESEPSTAEVAAFLERRIRLEINCLIAYSQLTDYFDMPRMDHRSKGHPLDRILGELDDEDHALGRPARSAIVVCKGEDSLGIPGNGFFSYVCGQRGIKVPRSSEDKVLFHAAEVKKLQEHYTT